MSSFFLDPRGAQNVKNIKASVRPSGSNLSRDLNLHLGCFGSVYFLVQSELKTLRLDIYLNLKICERRYSNRLKDKIVVIVLWLTETDHCQLWGRPWPIKGSVVDGLTNERRGLTTGSGAGQMSPEPEPEERTVVSWHNTGGNIELKTSTVSF